jgi:hypothetical protein
VERALRVGQRKPLRLLYPDQLAERRYRQRDDICIRQFRLRNFALPLVVTRNGPNEDVGIGCHLHRLPAQPRAATLLICAIEREGPLRLLKRSKTSEILPVGRAACIAMRPSGSLSTAIFSPGCTPICFSRSLRSVTCPLAVTVSVLMAWPRVAQASLLVLPPEHEVAVWGWAARGKSFRHCPCEPVNPLTTIRAYSGC